MAYENQEELYKFSLMDGTYLPVGLEPDHPNEGQTIDDEDNLVANTENTGHDDIINTEADNDGYDEHPLISDDQPSESAVQDCMETELQGEGEEEGPLMDYDAAAYDNIPAEEAGNVDQDIDVTDTGVQDIGLDEDTGVQDAGLNEDTGVQDAGLDEDTGVQDTGFDDDTAVQETGFDEDTGVQDTGFDDTGVQETGFDEDTGVQDTGLDKDLSADEPADGLFVDPEITHENIDFDTGTSVDDFGALIDTGMSADDSGALIDTEFGVNDETDKEGQEMFGEGETLKEENDPALPCNDDNQTLFEDQPVELETDTGVTSADVTNEEEIKHETTDDTAVDPGEAGGCDPGEAGGCDPGEAEGCDPGEAEGCDSTVGVEVSRQESLDDAGGYGILSAVEESAIDSLAGGEDEEEVGATGGTTGVAGGDGSANTSGNITSTTGETRLASETGKEESKEELGDKKKKEENKAVSGEKIAPKEILNVISDPERESRFKYIFRSARFFAMKSGNFENVELAKRFCVWSTPPFNEVRLNQAYRECSNVILIFSVQESGRFQGFARLSGPSEKADPPVPWVLPPGFKGRAFATVFRLDWICRIELGFQVVQQLCNPWNQNKPVRMGRDGQEVEPGVGETLCRLFPVDPFIDLHAIARLSKQALRAASGKFKDRGDNSVRPPGQSLPPPPHHQGMGGHPGQQGPRHMMPQPLMGMRPGGPHHLMPPHLLPGSQHPPLYRQQQPRFALPPPVPLLDPASMRRARMPQDLGRRDAPNNMDARAGPRDNGFRGDGSRGDGSREEGCHGDRMRRGGDQQEVLSIAAVARSDMLGLAYSLRGR